MDLLLENRVLVQRVAVSLLFALSLWKGSGPERSCSAVLLAMVAVDVWLRDIASVPMAFTRFDLAGFAIDAGGLLGLVAISLRANRLYPLALAAAQMVAFSSHMVRAMVEPVSSLAFYLLYSMPFYFQIGILAVGLARHIGRRARVGQYRAWRGILPRSAPSGVV